MAPGNPALGDERALRRAQPLDRLEPLELAGDRGAQGAKASGVREQERLALGPYGGDGLRELRQAALHRLDGRAEREALERLGQRGLANLCPAEQGAHGVPMAVTEHDQAADAAAVDARPDQMQAIAQLLGELLAKRVDHLLVVGVEDECDGAQPQDAELLVVEVGELGRERQEPLERLQIPREDQALVPERVQAPAQGLDPGRQALQLGVRLAGIQWARRRRLVVGSGVGRDRRQQLVGPRRQQTEPLAASRTRLLVAQPLDGLGGARIGDLHEAEPVELADHALDLAPAAEDLDLGHGHEHAATPPGEAPRR